MSELKLDEKIKDVEKRFGELEQRRQRATEQRANLDRQIGQIVEEQVRLQGEARALQGLKEPEEKKPEPKPVIPSKKKEKK